MGTYWEYFDIFPPNVSEEGKPSETVPSHVRIPLAMIFNPNLLKGLRQTPLAPPGNKLTLPGSNIIEGADLPKDQFLDLMKGAMVASSSLKQQREEDLKVKRETFAEKHREAAEGESREQPPPRGTPPQTIPATQSAKDRLEQWRTERGIPPTSPTPPEGPPARKK